MSPVANTVLEAALNLPLQDRAELVSILIESLDGPADPDAAADWDKEIERRVRQVEAGTVALVDWPDARARIVASLAKPRK